MRLADFIESNVDSILGRWDDYASTLLPDARHLDASALRDHGEEILAAIVKDLRRDQTRAQQREKSLGLAPPDAAETAAQTHAVLRASKGFSIRHLVGEYRALRASVLRQWLDVVPLGRDTLDDMVRFNEAIDQAIAESVDFFTTLVERWRSLFLGALGHDLRTPLNSILMTAEMISRQSPPPGMQQHIERMVRGGERMTELLNDLLDYNRVSLGGRLSITRKATDLADVAVDEVRMLRAAHPDTKLDLTITGSCKGTWDDLRIRQALTNLVDNAVKYGDGQAVSIDVAGEENLVSLSVANPGPEISATDLQTIFDPLKRGRFTAADEPREHLGLGLFIVRQAVEAHGGSIVVESRDGKTTFTATLPKEAPGGDTDRAD